MELAYSSALTGAPFMFYEFKQLVALKNQGDTNEEIRTKVLKENLFQLEKLSSIKRGLPYVIQRVNVLDETLRNYVIEEPFRMGKVINLYTIMKTDRLFFEFMNEVITEKIENQNLLLEKKDMNTFFSMKAEQDDTISAWTEQTVRKLQQVHTKILLEVGMLKDKKSWELSKIIIDHQLKDHLIRMGDAKYIKALAEQSE